MLAEGVEFMMIGMGTVFAFLALLVLAMNTAGWVINTYFPIAATAPAGPPTTATVNEPDMSDAEVAVALAAAYRRRQE